MTTKSTPQLHNCTKHIAHTHTPTQMYIYIYIYIYIFIFENELFPKTELQPRQHVDAVGCGTFYSELSSMFVFDIL
jgi:hypothetical protein